MSRQLGFHFDPMCATAGITHLAYTDDLLLFAREDESTITLMADCQKGFGDVARLRPNLNKSNIYFAGVDDRTRNKLLDITGSSKAPSLSAILIFLWQQRN